MPENEENSKITNILLALDEKLAYPGGCPGTHYVIGSCDGGLSGRFFYSASFERAGKVFQPCRLHLHFYADRSYEEYFPEEEN